MRELDNQNPAASGGSIKRGEVTAVVLDIKAKADSLTIHLAASLTVRPPSQFGQPRCAPAAEPAPGRGPETAGVAGPIGPGPCPVESCSL